MRQEFLQGCATEQEALERAPWAAVAIEVDGGYRVFESVDDARTWEAQE